MFQTIYTDFQNKCYIATSTMVFSEIFNVDYWKRNHYRNVAYHNSCIIIIIP